jgi:hypothetical protein
MLGWAVLPYPDQAPLRSLWTSEWLRFVNRAALAGRPFALAAISIHALSEQERWVFAADLVRTHRQRMRLQPKRAGLDGRINSGPLPPIRFIAATVQLAMRPSKQRHREFVAGFAPKRRLLFESQVMSVPVGRNQAWLFGTYRWRAIPSVHVSSARWRRGPFAVGNRTPLVRS